MTAPRRQQPEQQEQQVPVTCELHDHKDCKECTRTARRIWMPDVVASGRGINAPWDYGPGTGGTARFIGA